jgi:hypothetical protein
MTEGRRRTWDHGRLTMLALALLVGGMIVSAIYDYWAAFWIFQDPKQTSATVIAEGAHGVCDYQYAVNGIQYAGSGQRGRTLPREAHVGTQAPVYFSASHPWLSSPETPAPSPWQAPAIIALLLGAEFFLLKWVIKFPDNPGKRA